MVGPQYPSRLPDDSGEVPKPNIVVGGSIPGREIVSLLDIIISQMVKCLMCSKKQKKRHIYVVISWQLIKLAPTFKLDFYLLAKRM
jgi:hypothetical protein